MARTSAVLTILGIVLAGCSKAPPETHNPSTATPIPVHIVTVGSEPVSVTYEATGTVRAKTTATISARITGYVREVTAQVGDRVREGQLLVTLDARDLENTVRRAEAMGEEIRSAMPEADSAVAAAKANAELARSTFNRMQELFNKKSISNQEFDEASARVKAADATVAMAQAKRTQLDARLRQAIQEMNSAEVMRGYASVAAPFSGTVTAKSVEHGNLAQPGVPLLTIEREGAFRLEAAVDESRLGSIRTGQNVLVKLDGLDRILNARVSEIVPSVNSASRSGLVKIDLPVVAGLRSGMFGHANFSFGSRNVVAIPIGSVVDQGQLQSVFVVEGGTARVRLITLGQRQVERAEVLSGLNAGDSLIFPLPVGLLDGAKVEVGP